ADDGQVLRAALLQREQQVSRPGLRRAERVHEERVAVLHVGDGLERRLADPFVGHARLDCHDERLPRNPIRELAGDVEFDLRTRPEQDRAMPTLTSIRDIDLTPVPGKRYCTTDREWREEFIYFLMVDRFHDDQPRAPVVTPGRTKGIATPDDFYGGTLRGITRNLDYVAGLGCTAIWLSPIFENNGPAYHGYDINNYLTVDPRFGTKQDLIDLVDAAHAHRRDGRPFPIRVILDVVVNH